MGFGYVFLGCLLTVNIPYHNYTDGFAVALILFGLSTLAPYARGFSLAFKAGLPLLGVGFLSFFAEILRLIGLWSAPALLFSLLSIVMLIGKFFFYWFLFMGVDEVARETDIPKLRAHAMRSRFLTPIFCAMGLFLEAGLFSQHDVFLQYFLLAFILFGVIYALLNCKTVYECYMLICFEGDENMDEKPPRFSFARGKKEKGEKK